MGWTTSQQEALLNTIQRRNERIVLQKQLAQTIQALTTRQGEQSALYKQWQREQADVDRLNRLSWASVFYDLLNRKEEQISKEVAEAQQAKLQYDILYTTVVDLQKQHTDQENRLAQYTTIDTEYDQLIQAKRLALSTDSNEVGNQYQQYVTDLTQQNHHLQELDEAHKAGLQALSEVLHLKELLNQAHNWGTWDMLGGSAISSMIKYNKLDDVRDQSYRVTRSLDMFQSEYADVRQGFLTDWKFDNNLTRFVDIFFDNIFTDIAVQSRINKALGTAQTLESQLVQVLLSLKNQLEQAVEQTKLRSEELRRFLEKA